MRWGPILVMLVFCLGAIPAPAQDSPGIIPMAKEPDAKPATVKPAEAKPTEAKAVTPKPADVKPATVKPTTLTPAAAKTVAAKPATPKPAAAKAELAPDVFAGIPPDERLKIQAALLWTGDYTGCLLYTSDAADDLTRVDLGGRRIL